MSYRRRAFTTIELLAAIGILALLAGILVIGIKSVSGSAKARATRLAMETLRSMLAEVESNPVIKILADGRDLPAPCTLQAPLNVSREFSAATNDSKIDPKRRFGQAVVRTQRAMRLMLSNPANKQAIGKIPAEQLLRVVWTSGVAYQPEDQVEFPEGSGTFLKCTQGHTSSGTQPNSGNWTADIAHTPIFADGWGNPIIFVPRTGLVVLNVESLAPVVLQTIQATSGRPFFASAGEDASFQGVPDTNDLPADQDATCLRGAEDNLYSFEN